jgi:hypothetical protein
MNRIFRYVLVLSTWAVLLQFLMPSEKAICQAIEKQEESACNISREIIYLHTDREIYIAGDNLFFKVYLYDEDQKKLSLRSKIAYIIVSNSKNRKIIQSRIILSEGMGYSSLQLPDTLETGLYQIIAFTNWMRNFGESAFFCKQLMIANKFDANLTTSSPDFKKEEESSQKSEQNKCLTISAGRGIYSQREKVTLLLSLTAETQANVSISVAEDTQEKYNNKTLTQTLSTINGNNTQPVTSKPAYKKVCEYLIEDKGYIISGFVHDTASPAGITVVLSTPDSIPNLLYSITNTTGRFFFQLNDFYYNKELYINIPDQNKEKKATFSLDDKYALHGEHASPTTPLSDQSKQFIKKSQTIASINKTYKIQSVLNETEPASGIFRRNVYYEADHNVLLKDYVPLNNFSEIVREILPFIRLRKYDYGYEAEIVDPENKIYLKNPAVFLNGMLVNNINNVINLGSDKIHRIETITHRRIYGSIVFNGILSIVTTTDVGTDKLISPRSLHLMPITFQHHTQYLIPEYSTDKKKAGRNPDFRQLLYWNPSLEINGTVSMPVEFYTSDNKGNYMINVEGIAADGTPISCTAYFEVR